MTRNFVNTKNISYLCKSKDRRGVATRRQGQTDSLSLLYILLSAKHNVGSMNTEQEIWKPVVGYEGYYEVSSLGRVRSLDRVINCSNGSKLKTRGKIKKISTSQGTGYQYVMIVKNRMAKRISLHRLVAMAFIPNPENKPCVDHINTVRTDNRVENLRWATYKENFQNPITKQKMLDSNANPDFIRKRILAWSESRNGYAPKSVAQIKDGKIVKIWRSAFYAAKELGYDNCTIRRRCKIKYGQSYGFVWLYVEDVDFELLKLYNNGTPN